MRKSNPPLTVNHCQSYWRQSLMLPSGTLGVRSHVAAAAPKSSIAACALARLLNPNLHDLASCDGHGSDPHRFPIGADRDLAVKAGIAASPCVSRPEREIVFQSWTTSDLRPPSPWERHAGSRENISPVTTNEVQQTRPSEFVCGVQPEPARDAGLKR